MKLPEINEPAWLLQACYKHTQICCRKAQAWEEGEKYIYFLLSHTDRFFHRTCWMFGIGFSCHLTMAVISVHAGCSAVIRKRVWFFWFCHFKTFRHVELSIKWLFCLVDWNNSHTHTNKINSHNTQMPIAQPPISNTSQQHNLICYRA